MTSEPDRSISELLRDIVANVQQMVRSELLLAKTEVKEELARLARTAPLMIGAVVIGCYALGFLLLFVVYALATVLATWAAALIVGGVLGMISAGLLAAGFRRVKEMGAVAPKTVQSVKENMEWAKRQIR